MIRTLALSFALALVAPANAQVPGDHTHEQHHDHGEHDDHFAEAQGLRAVHAWANATDASSALVYVELENTSDATAILIGVAAEIAESAAIVGLEIIGGELQFTPIPRMPIAAGSDLIFSPNALAIQLSGLDHSLSAGESFEIEFDFETTHLHAVVTIEPANAIQHSHAAHHHYSAIK